MAATTSFNQSTSTIGRVPLDQQQLTELLLLIQSHITTRPLKVITSEQGSFIASDETDEIDLVQLIARVWLDCKMKVQNKLTFESVGERYRPLEFSIPKNCEGNIIKVTFLPKGGNTFQYTLSKIRELFREQKT